MSKLILPPGVEPPTEKPEPQEAPPGDATQEPEALLLEVTVKGPQGDETITTPRMMLVAVGEDGNLSVKSNLLPQELHMFMRDVATKMAIAQAQHGQQQVMPAHMGIDPRLIDKVTKGGRA